MVVGASSSKIVDVDRSTNEGDVIGPALLMVSLRLRERVTGNRTHQLIDRRHYAPQVCFTYHPFFIFLHIGDNCMYFCWG